ncbi:MAG: polysaccharide pyruvyl transferase family protein [Prevotella sp.]|nr:polysaccharide pyruvyl transferase family protein [Candidatus Prevotella equi]
MKVGILTFHRAHNYGAILQAMATRVILTRYGHDAYFVDYWPSYHASQYMYFSRDRFNHFRSIKSKFGYLYKQVLKRVFLRKRINAFESFIQKNIQPFCKPTSEKFDVVVIGSDQVWWKNCLWTHQYDPFYFGKNNLRATRQVSYAASMGILPNNNEDRIILKDLLSNLDKISVREDSLLKLVESLGYKCEKHLDPTLLLSSDEWNNIIPLKKIDEEPYVLFYDLNRNSFDYNEILKFAEKRKLKIKTLVGSHNQRTGEGIYQFSDPGEFVNLIRGAEFVFSSSFHGMVFSIIYQKEFFASFSRNSDRAATLLEALGIKNRLLVPMSQIENIANIEYESVMNKMRELRIPSLNYLQSL